MFSLIFVHGTGVRTQEFESTINAIRLGLAGVDGAKYEILGCDWGKDHGAKFGNRSIPDYVQKKSQEEKPVLDESLDLWTLLIADPYLEIKLVAELADGEESEFSSGKKIEYYESQLFSALTSQAGIAQLQFHHVDADQLLQAASDVFQYERTVRAWVNARESADTAPDGTAAGASMLARAIIANWMLVRWHEGSPAVVGAVRDALVSWIADALAGSASHGQTKGIIGDACAMVMAPVRRLAMGALELGGRAGMFAVRRYRAGLTDATGLRVGDILLYQARGEGIRQQIQAQIRAARYPVILLGHSLGGIACVDLLATVPELPVWGLVTVGSQAPYLHEMNALWSLASDAALPETFPSWLNFYDRNDLLSYLAKPVFGDKVVEDIEIKSNQPFPLSHSAYWGSAILWSRLHAFAKSLSA